MTQETPKTLFCDRSAALKVIRPILASHGVDDSEHRGLALRMVDAGADYETAALMTAPGVVANDIPDDIA